MPGLLIQLGLFGSMFVGFAIISDWRGGVIERFRVTPVSRLAVMSGRVLRDTLVLVVQAVILVLVGIAFGLRAPVSAVFISLGFIVLVAVGLASVSYATALTVKSEDAFAPMLNSVIVPLVLLSGIMLPMTLAPGWLQGVARVSPFRYIIDAMREAFRGPLRQHDHARGRAGGPRGGGGVPVARLAGLRPRERLGHRSGRGSTRAGRDARPSLTG